MEQWDTNSSDKNMKNLQSRLKIYWLIWLKMAEYAWAETFLNRWTNILFLIGKAIRFSISLFFLILLKNNLQQFADYTTSQVIVFFLTYQFLDTLGQIFFRGVYLFSWQVRSGELDFYLAKPINPLFRILTGKPDILDFLFIFPTTAISVWLITQLNIVMTWPNFFLYLALLLNGFLIVTGIHILVICLGVITTEVDNAIMLYRDVNNLARFPVDIYREPLRTILFFVIPVGVMNTIPAQVLLNVKPTYSLPTAFAVGFLFLFLSLRVWAWSLKKYTSAGG
jgi:ABC-2 type transport system permease protein